MMNEIIINPKIKALIFDCDGTLVDSMPVHTKAWKLAITENGGKFDYQFFDSVKGMKSPDIINLYNRTFKQNLEVKDVLTIKHKYFKDNLSLITPITPVVNVAKKYHDILPMAVVSGGSKKNVIAELESTGLLELFDIILTADDNINPKPAPDLFLAAAKLMKIEPEFCQVFEDGKLGIEGAEKAGMIVTDVTEYL